MKVFSIVWSWANSMRMAKSVQPPPPFPALKHGSN